MPCEGCFSRETPLYTLRSRLPRSVRGCLAHKKQPPPLGPQEDPKYSPAVGFQEGGVSQERGSRVACRRLEPEGELRPFGPEAGPSVPRRPVRFM
jgi:hypothetical protein